MEFLYNIHNISRIFHNKYISITSAVIYFHWYLKKDNTIINTGVNTETVIY